MTTRKETTVSDEKFNVVEDATLERLSKLSEVSGCPCHDLSDLADQKFPKELSELPVKSISASSKTSEIEASTSNIRFIGTYIEEITPTDEEIAVHVDSMVKNYGSDIDGWLIKLARITIPGFVGEEPTIEEFFSENFDSSRVKEKYMLVSYPSVKIK